VFGLDPIAVKHQVFERVLADCCIEGEIDQSFYLK
jgi:hypothetical protein